MPSASLRRSIAACLAKAPGDTLTREERSEAKQRGNPEFRVCVSFLERGKGCELNIVPPELRNLRRPRNSGIGAGIGDVPGIVGKRTLGKN